MNARCAVFALAFLGCGRRSTPTIHRDDPKPDASAEVIVDAEVGTTSTFEGRRLHRNEGAASCVATDALYVRSNSSVLGFSGSGAPKVVTLEPSFATAARWDARGDDYAWSESDEEVGPHAMLRVSVGAGASTLHPGSDYLKPTLCGGWTVHPLATAYPGAPGGHAARTDHLVIRSLRGAGYRELTSGPYVSLHVFGCAMDHALVLFNDIGSPELHDVSLATGTKRLLAKRAGEWWLASAAVDANAALLATNSTGAPGGRVDAVERIELTGAAPPKKLFAPAADEEFWAIFASAGTVLVPLTISRAYGTPKEHALLVLDARSGAELRRIRTDDDVLAAWHGDSLVWCTASGVYTLP